MAIPVEMPKLSDTMEEGVVSAWQAEEGDEVSAGDVIAQVETDKATMDLEVFDDGVLLKKVVGEGEAVPLGALIAVLGEQDEDISDLLAEYDAGEAAEEAETEEVEEEPERVAEEAEEAEVPTGGDGAPSQAPGEKRQPQRVEAPAGNGRVKASPLARRIASENEVDLTTVEGSGPQGRIIKRDIEAILEGRTEEVEEAVPAPAVEEERAFRMPGEAAPEEETLYESEGISQMRKAIARRLAQSKYSAPHYYLTVDIDVEKAVAFREELNQLAEEQERPRISFNDLITKACALALRQHPDVNASYLADEGEIRRYNRVHVGVAVAIDEGLITPVIRNADQKGLGQIAEETRALAEKARNRELQPEEYEGSTFTTSNLGMYGIEEFTAIINPPNSCILAIGTIRDEPVVKDGEVVPGKRMRATLSCDHRLVDGATGAEFLATVRTYLEEPMSLML